MTSLIETLEEQKLSTFQTKDSLEEAKHYIDMHILLDVPSNQVHSALAIYHNTLINELIKKVQYAQYKART
jgi:hypothetical protein